MRPLLPAIALLAACTMNGLTPVNDAGQDGGNDTGSLTEEEQTVDAFDPYENVAANPACEDFDGTPYNGATSYFVGEFTIDGDLIYGYEEWVLFANSTWQSASPYPGWDCKVRWDAFGTILPRKTCVGCSHEVSFDLTWNEDRSDCQPALQQIEGPAGEGNITYYVQARPDGTARFEFPSGTHLGDGVFGADRAAYVSDSQCTVF